MDSKMEVSRRPSFIGILPCPSHGPDSFSSGDEVSSPPVKIEIEDADSGTYEGTVKVTVFGKYQASFRAAYVE